MRFMDVSAIARSAGPRPRRALLVAVAVAAAALGALAAPALAAAAPVLSLQADHSGSFLPGHDGAFELTLSNTGDAATTPPTSIDVTLPQHVDYQSATSDGDYWTCTQTDPVHSPSKVDCTSAVAIAAGGAAPELTLDVKAAADAPTGAGIPTEQMKAQASDSGATPATASASNTITYSAVAQLAVGATHSPAGDVRAGEIVTFTIAGRNNGNAPLSGSASLTDTPQISMAIDSHLDLISVSTADDSFWGNPNLGAPGCTTLSLFGTTSVGCFASPTASLAVDASLPAITIKARVKPGASGSIVMNPVPGSALGNRSLDRFAIVASPVLQVSKSHSGLFRRGGDGTYDLAVDNAGSQDTDGSLVTLTDTLPAGLTFDSATSTGDYWDCSGSSGQDVSCVQSAAAVIAAGASAPTLHLSVNVAAGTADSVTNEAAASGGGAVSIADSDKTPIFASGSKAVRLSIDPAQVADPDGAVGSFFRLRNLSNPSGAPVFLDFTKLPSKAVLKGAVDPSGNLRIPRSGVDFPTYTIKQLNAGLPNPLDPSQPLLLDVDVKFIPTGDWTGTYDQATGDVTLKMPVTITLTPKLSVLGLSIDVATCQSDTTVDELTTGHQDPPKPGVNPPPVTDGSPVDADGNGVLIDNNVAVPGVDCPTVNPLVVQLAGIGAPVIELAVNGLLGAPAQPGATDMRLEFHVADPETEPVLDLGMTADPDPFPLVLTQPFPDSEYDLTVTNVGDVASSGPITVTDTLPDGLVFDPAVSGGVDWTCNATGQDVTCTNPNAAGLASGASADPLTISFVVRKAAWPSVTNAAHVSGGGARGTVTTVVTTDVRLQGQQLGLSLVDDSGDYTVGSQAHIKLSVEDLGTVSFTSKPIVTGHLPPGIVFVSGTGDSNTVCEATDPTASGQDVTCTFFGSVHTGTPRTVDILVDVGTAAKSPVQTTWTGSSPDAPSFTNPTVTTVEHKVLQSKLALAMSHNGDLRTGGSGAFVFELSNVGDGSTTTNPVTIADSLPDGVSFQGASSQGGFWDCSSSNGQSVKCVSTGPIDAGKSAPDLSLRVAVGNAAFPRVVNRALATGGAASNVAGATDSVDTARPQLALAKSHGADFVVGRDGTYELTAFNTSPAATDGSAVAITDTLPSGLTFKSASSTGGYWTCHASGQRVTCTSSAVIAGFAAAPALRLTVAVGQAAAGGVTNVATVSGGGSPSSTVSDHTPVGTPSSQGSPALSISKTHSGDFRAGEQGGYAIAVSNVGTATTSGTITVRDPLPVGLSFVSAAGDGWTCGASDGKVSCTRKAPIAPGAQAPAIDLQVGVGDDAAPGVTNTAFAQGGGAQGQVMTIDPTKVAGAKPPSGKPPVTVFVKSKPRLRHGAVRVTLSCHAHSAKRCKGTLTARARRGALGFDSHKGRKARVGHRRFSIKGGKHKVRIKLGRRARRTLARKGHLKIRFTARTTNRPKPKSKGRTLTVRAHKQHKRGKA